MHLATFARWISAAIPQVAKIQAPAISQLPTGGEDEDDDDEHEGREDRGGDHDDDDEDEEDDD
jgi:ABC-type Zn2+ transport system substrate-binding protein/surface adhesin